MQVNDNLSGSNHKGKDETNNLRNWPKSGSHSTSNCKLSKADREGLVLWTVRFLAAVSKMTSCLRVGSCLHGAELGTATAPKYCSSSFCTSGCSPFRSHYSGVHTVHWY